MKIFNQIFTACVLLLAIVMSGCNGGNGDLRESAFFKKIDLRGAVGLTLAHDANDVQRIRAYMPSDEGEDEPHETANIGKPLYTVSADGTMVEAQYGIEIIGVEGEVLDSISANLRLVMYNMFPIDGQWLWLEGCHYEYPGMDEMDKSTTLWKALDRIIRDAGYGLNYLVRLSDGALFEWKVGIPYLESGDKQDVADIVSTLGSDIVSIAGVNMRNGGLLYQLQDQGKSMNVKQLLSEDVYATMVLPTNDTYLGTFLNYEGRQGRFTNYGYPCWGIPSVINTRTNDIVELTNPYDTGTMEKSYYFFVMNGQLIYGSIANGYQLEFRQVDISESPYLTATVGEVIASAEAARPFESHANLSGWGFSRFVVPGDEISWIGEMDGVHAYTFNLTKKQIISRLLPEHYTSNQDLYYDGVAYLMQLDGNVPSYFYVCDLTKEAAERVDIDWSGLGNYEGKLSRSTISLSTDYDPKAEAFLGSARLTDGRTVSLLVPAKGENRGKLQALVEGEGNGGKIVDIMIRLN